MKNTELSHQVVTKIKSWKGYEAFDGADIEFRSQDPAIFANHSHTVLMQAVERGDVNVVQHLIQAGADVNAVNNGTQQCPLLCLPESLKKRVKISTLLINAGANVNYIQKDEEVFDDWFNTPLIDACTNGRRELVKILLEAGADVNLSWKDGMNAICIMERDSKHYISILKELIDASANVNACGGWALQGAIGESNIEAIELLLSSGASLDIQCTEECYNGRTPFMSFLKGDAVYLGADEEQELFSLFCKNFSDVNIQDSDGRNLLSYALDTYIGNDDFGLFVLDKILFNASIDINQTDNNGNTNLTSLLLSIEEEGHSTDALYDGERYRIESLLIAGSDIEIRNREGESPKIIAKRIGNEEIQSLLENSNGFINAENYMGRTPLFVACLQGHIEKIRWLINKGAYVNAKNKCHKIPRGIDLYGTFFQTHKATVKPKLYTALMAALGAQNLETVKALITAGADINQQDSDGNTALMLYAKANWLEGAKELINAGADTNIVNKWYETASVIAVKNDKSRAMDSNEPEKLSDFLEERTSGNFFASVLSSFFSIFRPK